MIQKMIQTKQTKQIKRMNTGRIRAVSRALAGITLALVAGFSPMSARAQSVFAVTDTLRFGEFDLTSGSFTQRANFTGDPFLGVGGQIYGLAFSGNFPGSNSNVFAIDGGNGLYQINTANNTYTLAQQFQYDQSANGLNGQVLQSIAFDKATGQLYGLGANNSDGSNATLYRLSTTNVPNNVTRIGAFGGLNFNTFGGLAIVTDNNGVSTGYATQGRADNGVTGPNANGPVYQINLANGTSVPLGGTPLPNGENVAGFTNPVSALAGVAGQLKAVDYTMDTSPVNRTYTVDQTTGIATFQGTYTAATFGNILAITDMGQMNTPEPGTLGLLAMGLTLGAGGVTVRRRKKK